MPALDARTEPLPRDVVVTARPLAQALSAREWFVQPHPGQRESHTPRCEAPSTRVPLRARSTVRPAHGSGASSVPNARRSVR